MNDLMGRIKDVARAMGITDVSVADASAWDTDPLVSSRIAVPGRPLSILPTAKSVIVIGVPLQKAILATAPSIYYKSLYDTVNILLDQAGERIALELGAEGFDAVYVPRDGYHGLAGLKMYQSAFFSHRHAAYLAGMGTFGINNAILTPDHGPRMRFTSIITSAELPSGGPMKRELCIKCRKCTKACPGEAIGDKPYPESVVRKERCLEVSAELAAKGISPCGRCIAVCPVGRDNSDPVPTDAAIAEIRKYVKNR